jgi:hypothetical protein
MSAVKGAVQSAVSPAVTPANSVNTVVGYPASETYPGSLDPTQYAQDAPVDPKGVSGPPYGSWSSEPFTETLPEQAPGGGYQDTAWQTGHDAPQAPWDSSSGPPFAPSGALPVLLHAEDTGGVYVHEHVVPAAIGFPRRTTVESDPNIRLNNTQELIGQMSPEGGRIERDEYQTNDYFGYDPFVIDYSARPVYNNLAYQSEAITATDSAYTPSGNVPDMSVFDYAAEAYVAPPDPSSPNPVAAGDSGFSSGWGL